MKVRTIDSNNDWTFGKGKNNYKKDISATVQNIKTRLQSFLNDCFFDINAGVDWFTYLGSKRIDELKIAITTVILNSDDVISCNEVNVSVGATRIFFVQYSVNTSYGEVTQETTLEV